MSTRTRRRSQHATLQQGISRRPLCRWFERGKKVRLPAREHGKRHTVAQQHAIPANAGTRDPA
jgi:hypothetical protein